MMVVCSPKSSSYQSPLPEGGGFESFITRSSV
jgi:hypothetical protein